MADNTISAEQMRRAIGVVERRMAPSWMGAMAAVKSQLTLTQIAELLTAGNLEGAVQSTGVAMSNWFNTQWMPAYNTSASQTAAFLQRSLGIPMSFDAVNESAIRHLSQTRMRLVSGFMQEQTQSSMAALQESFRTGANPRATARAFRNSIGLTANQERAVANYGRLLRSNSSEALTRTLRDRRFDPTVRRALSGGDPLDSKQVDRMVGRYRQRMLKYRSEVIARTEALRSTNGGQKDMLDQAVLGGELQNDQLEQAWNTALDERVRGSHASMHGQVITGVNVPFISGLGNQLLYPGDVSAPAEDTVQCRCAVSTTITKIVVPA